jgi:hypothetical protein
MEKGFNYLVDTVTTDEYYSALNKITQTILWTPTEPLSSVDFEVGVLGLLPELRKIILTAGQFTSVHEHKEKHYYLSKIGWSGVLLEPFKWTNNTNWIRLCIYDLLEHDQNKKDKVDFYVPDVEIEGANKRALFNIQAHIRTNGEEMLIRPMEKIDNEEGQQKAKKFIGLWQEGLRNLLGVISNPVDDLELLEIDL